MRDATGGAVNIFIIVVFIVFALGYMAFNVNYTKAFRMKDKVISAYEKYDGECTSECVTELTNYANSIGYQPDTITCPTGGVVKENGYCVLLTKQESYADRKTKCYYRIVTKVNIEIPIIQYVTTFSAFHVTGDTKAIEIESECCNGVVNGVTTLNAAASEKCKSGE